VKRSGQHLENLCVDIRPMPQHVMQQRCDPFGLRHAQHVVPRRRAGERRVEQRVAFHRADARTQARKEKLADTRLHRVRLS